MNHDDLPTLTRSLFLVEWFEGKREDFYVRIRNARNGKTLLTSESYTTHTSAHRAARKLARYLAGAEVREVKEQTQ